MPPVLETIGATGKENESKYRSGRGTGLLVGMTELSVVNLFCE